MIGTDWKELSTNLDDDSAECISEIEKAHAEDCERMRKYFKTRKDNISWRLLKQQLTRMKRKDILQRVRKETYLTEGNLFNFLIIAENTIFCFIRQLYFHIKSYALFVA